LRQLRAGSTLARLKNNSAWKRPATFFAFSQIILLNFDRDMDSKSERAHTNSPGEAECAQYDTRPDQAKQCRDADTTLLYTKKVTVYNNAGVGLHKTCRTSHTPNTKIKKKALTLCAELTTIYPIYMWCH
jgi:hypothetical protein